MNGIKSVIVLIIITIFCKVLGFTREIVLSYVYGASSIADVYLISMSIPNVLFTTIGLAISTTFIPIYCEIDNTKTKDESLNFVNNIFNIVMILSLIVSILGFIFAKPLVNIFAMDFSGEKLILAVRFTKIMIFSMIFIGINSILSSYLQVKGNFTIPGMVTLPQNIILIIFILLSSKGNIYFLAIGTLIGAISQVLFQIPFAIKKGYKYKPYINLRDENIKKMLWLIIPVFIGVMGNQMNFIIDRSLASTLGDGVIVVLNNSMKLVEVVRVLFIGAIGIVVYPMLSNLIIENNRENFINVVTKSINSVIIITIPIMVGFIILSYPITKLVFERGAFDSNATYMTSVALAMYTIGIISLGLNDILGKVFYSLKDTKTPMINEIIAVAINLVLNIILSKYMGYAGLALATSISSLVCILLLFRSLKKKVGYYGQDKINSTILKSIVSSVIMGCIVYFTYKYFSQVFMIGYIQEILALLLSVLIGVLVYSIFTIMFRVDEVYMILDMIKDKIKNYKNKI